MHFWGKLIGGFFGFLLGGPLGAILGIVIGHMFDKGLRQQWQGLHFNLGNQAQAQQAFFDTTFLVMGHIAKADGRVSEAELQAARIIMQRMNLNEQMRQRAMELFTQGKQSDFNLDQALANLVQACHRNKVLLRMFVEIQMQAMLAESSLSQTKQQILQKICQYLGFAPLNFTLFEHLFGFGRSAQDDYQQRTYRGAPRAHSRMSVQDAYAVLNVPSTANDSEIKKAYRRLMSQNHPDKLVSKGLPEEMIKLATEKTQNIKAAYELICEARGI